MDMPSPPDTPKAVAFFDGQNLFHAAREAFGYGFPNYDPLALARSVCAAEGWDILRVHFYTGVPDASDNAFWNHFWNAKIAHLGRRGTRTFSRPLRYRNQTVDLPDGSQHTFLVGQEKGVDVRIALDIVHAAHEGLCDVLLRFSQDQDLSEVADEVRHISRAADRWLKIASAFPVSPTARNRRGVDRTDWIWIDRAAYDACIDPRDYRPPRRSRRRSP